MSFWDKVKSFLGVGGERAPDAERAARVEGPWDKPIHDAFIRRARLRQRFEAVDLAGEAGARDVPSTQAACRAVGHLFEAGVFDELGYSRTWRGGDWTYHPAGDSLAEPAPRAPQATRATAPWTGAPVTPGAPPSKPSQLDPFAGAKSLLALSTNEISERLKRRWWWQSVFDRSLIPPASDEGTALVDRLLVLRGLLTELELAEIHRVGDLWLKLKNRERAATVAGAASAQSAIEEARRQKAARKEAKRAEAKARREARAAAVLERKKKDIVFLGRGVSSRLGDRRAHVEKLAAAGLPVLATPLDVATALGVAVPELRWLCYHADATDHPHYVTFEVPKRSGGTRLLASPHEKLQGAQRWVLDHVLAKLTTEEPAHGFVPGRSTLSNATAHTGRDLVVNLDLKDFFPTITFPRVRGVFEGLGYSPAAATILALLTTECPRRPVDYDGKRYWVAVGERALPQGAPTSPALSNQCAKKLDRRLAGVARAMGFAYTRYADDLTFSAPEGMRGRIGWLLERVRHVVEEEGFAINPKKGRVQRKGGRQTVTGVVVNERPGLPREEVRRLRAILHRAKKEGLEAQNREALPHFAAHLRGKLAYLHMIDPKRAAPLLAELDALEGR